MKKAFGLVEVIVSIAVLTMVVIAPITAAQMGLQVSRDILSETTASHLAAEGLELTQRYVQNNILAGNIWRNLFQGLCDGGTVVETNLDTCRFTVDARNLNRIEACVSGDCEPLRRYDGQLNPAIMYGYGDGGVSSPFTRTMIIAGRGNNHVTITSVVTWQERGRDKEVSLTRTFFNWYY